MTPKERVKLNVYKELLVEEKRKGKRVLAVGASMFVIGVFSNTAIESIRNPKVGEVTPINSSESVAAAENPINWEGYFEGEIVKDRQTEVETKDLFASGLGF